MLMSKSCSEFSELLAEKISMPGGGSAASLTGALGAALCSMAANFTIGKKNYEDVQEDVKSILEKSERIRKRFLEL
ncbi:MAG: cyclodeaminase/cyclohydrolase family protein, partial [Synergistaceae bacterium]|nr:cyclodeaminase/cyclohydrolase family protein [Synergistaceae bacterium]